MEPSKDHIFSDGGEASQHLILTYMLKSAVWVCVRTKTYTGSCQFRNKFEQRTLGNTIFTDSYKSLKTKANGGSQTTIKKLKNKFVNSIFICVFFKKRNKCMH